MCDPEVFAHGNAILSVGDCPYKIMEDLCARAKRPEVVFDWHYQAGSAVLLYIGPHHIASESISNQLDWLSNELWNYSYNEYEHVRSETAYRASHGLPAMKRVFTIADIYGPGMISIGQALNRAGW